MRFALGKRPNRDVPDHVLIQDVVEAALRLGQGTVTMHEYQQHGKYHPSTLQRRFGSWFTVLEMAGLTDSRSRIGISHDDLFGNLRDVWTLLGRQPKYDEIKKPLSKYSVGTYENRFGTWWKALEAFVEYVNDDPGAEATVEATGKPQSQFSADDSHCQPRQQTKREISARLRFSVLLRDGFRCQSCGRSPITSPGIELHVDHVVPWTRGGETVASNLQTKCRECNLGKGNAFNK